MSKERKHKAVELYKMKKISLGLASKLSGLTLSEFLDDAIFPQPLNKNHNFTILWQNN